MHVPIYVFIMHCTVFPVRSALHSQEASKVRSISINITSAAGFLQYLMAVYMPCALSRFVSSIMADLGSWRVVPATNQRRDLDAWTIPPDPKVSEIQRYWKSEKKHSQNLLKADYQVAVKRQRHSNWSTDHEDPSCRSMQIHRGDPYASIHIHTHPCRSMQIHAANAKRCKEQKTDASTHDSRWTRMQTQESNMLVERCRK